MALFNIYTINNLFSFYEVAFEPLQKDTEKISLQRNVGNSEKSKGTAFVMAWSHLISTEVDSSNLSHLAKLDFVTMIVILRTLRIKSGFPRKNSYASGSHHPP